MTVKDYFGHSLWLPTIAGNCEIIPTPFQPTEYTTNHKKIFSIPYKKNRGYVVQETKVHENYSVP